MSGHGMSWQVRSRDPGQVPVGEPAPVEAEHEPEGDPGEHQPGDDLARGHGDVPSGVQPRVGLRPSVAAVSPGAGRRLEVDPLGSAARHVIRGGYDETYGAAARSRCEHDDGRLLPRPMPATGMRTTRPP